MDLTRLLVRMALWSRRPPSKRWLIAAGIAIAVALVLVGIETFIGWPDALRAERPPRRFGIR